MMIIQFFVSESELRAYFEACGYTVLMKEETRWRPSGHNRTEAYEVDEMHVQIGESKTVNARELYEKTVKSTLLRTDLSAKLAIKAAIKTIK